MNRSLFNLDLKELKGPLDTFCEQRGYTARQKADFLRGVIKDAIGHNEATKAVVRPYAKTYGEGSRKYVRLSVDPVAYDTLLIAMDNNGQTSLPAFIEALALQSVVSKGIRAPSRRKGLEPDLVKMFSESNGNLHVIGMRVRSITERLKHFPENVSPTQFELLTELPNTIYKHTLVVAKALAALNPMKRIKQRN